MQVYRVFDLEYSYRFIQMDAIPSIQPSRYYGSHMLKELETRL
jgi:hypothetical protein